MIVLFFQNCCNYVDVVYDCYNKIIWLNIVNKLEEGYLLVINLKENRKICKVSVLILIQ